MNQIIIKTPRLVIHKLLLNHSCEVFEYRRNEGVQQYQSFHPKTIDEVKLFITSNTKNFNIEGKWYQFGVFLEKKLIGDIGIHFLGPENSQCEIGYTISPNYQRKGYGKESVVNVINFLFGELKKHRIIASLNPGNMASVLLLESIGFRKEGLFRKSIKTNEIWEDDLVYAILEEEWDIKKVI